VLSSLLRHRDARRALETAGNYREWYAAARKLDRLHGNDGWMQEAESPLFEAPAVQRTTRRLARLRRAGQIEELIEALEQGLYRHHHELINPRLYEETYCGESKTLARTFLREAARSLHYLAGVESPRYPPALKLELLSKAARTFGRSALLLSGGATLGIYHLGVVKALFEQGLLPRVISGSSMGAIIAAVVCTRTDAELRQFFQEPQEIHRNALKIKDIRTIIRERSLFERHELLAHIRANLLVDCTFAEAHARCGRILNISVAPTRKRQKPKLLNYLSSPDLLVAESAAVSCAMPLLYPPGGLKARDRSGRTIEYLESERWVDGSIGSDLPMARLSRLHNVNHYIVSQTNPYVYIFQSKSEAPSLPYAGLEVVGSLLHSQVCSVLDSARKQIRHAKVRPFFEQLHALTAQPYLGDINFHPRVDPTLLRKYVANPSLQECRRFIRGGERITWPKLAMVRDHTLVSRTFEACIRDLTARCG
jgi:NTE family protein